MKVRFLCPECLKYGRHHELSMDELRMAMCRDCGCAFDDPVEDHQYDRREDIE